MTGGRDEFRARTRSSRRSRRRESSESRVPVLWRTRRRAILWFVWERHDRAAPPMRKMSADGAEQRACVPELRHRVRKRSALENPPDSFPVPARLCNQCAARPFEIVIKRRLPRRRFINDPYRAVASLSRDTPPRPTPPDPFDRPRSIPSFLNGGCRARAGLRGEAGRLRLCGRGIFRGERRGLETNRLCLRGRNRGLQTGTA